MKNFKTPSLVLGGVLALAVFGCGNGTQVLDDQRLEDVISQGFQEQTGYSLTAIDCPSDRPLQQGDTFNCSATTDQGDAIVITVTQTDNVGNVHWSITG